MDNTLNYATILKQVIQDAVQHQPRLQNIQLHPICDPDSGHFLVLATGWDKHRPIHTILFHAHLTPPHITIQTDNFEDSLTQHLLNHGIPPHVLRDPNPLIQPHQQASYAKP